MKNPLKEIISEKKMSLERLEKRTGLSQDRIKELQNATISIELVEEKDYKKLLQVLNIRPFKVIASMLELTDMKPAARKNPGKVFRLLEGFDKLYAELDKGKPKKSRTRKKPDQVIYPTKK